MKITIVTTFGDQHYNMYAKNFMDSLPKEEKSENSDIQNQLGVSPEMAEAIANNLKLSNENNDFSQPK